MDEAERSENSIEAFKTAPIGKLLFIYSISSILSLLAMAAYETTDRVVVGQFVGGDALALMGAGLPFVFFLEAFCILLRVGCGTAMARFFGEGEIQKAKDFFRFSVVFGFLLGLAVMLLGLALAEPFARLCGATQWQAAGAAEYIRIIAVGCPFLFVMYVANAALNSAGMPRQATMIVVLAAILNIGLDFLFVVGFRWGLPGASWATSISQMTGAAFALTFFLRSNSKFQIRPAKPRFSRTFFKELVSVGFAASLFDFSFVMVATIVGNRLGHYGSELALAQSTIVSSCLAFVYMPITGVGVGLEPIVGYNYGSGDYKRVKQAVLYAISVTAAFFVLAFFCIQIFANEVAMIFGDTPAIVDEAGRALRINFLAMPLMAPMVIIPCALSGLGDAKYNLIINAVVQFGLQAVLLFVMPRFLGIDGVWAVTPVLDVVATTVCFFCLYIFFRQKGIIGATAEAA